MSKIIKNSRVINKKIVQKDSVFLSDSKTDTKKVEFDKTEDDTEYDETEKDDTEKETDQETEEETENEEEAEEIEKDETETEKEDEVEEPEYKEDVATEDGEYKIKTGEQCLYNNLEDEIIIDDDIDAEDKDEEIMVRPEDRITKDKLTSYEKVRILGLRAKQISLGAKILLKNYGNRSPLEIAELELKHKVLPFKIKRPLANKRVEIWKLSELKV
jgi:DNA-directed RNA polymerase subunit K/omega